MSKQDSKDQRMVTGLFPDRASAERAYGIITTRGYGSDDLNLMMSDDTRKAHFADKETELGNKAAEGAGVGAGIGGTLGAVLAGIAAVGTTLVLPGLGVVVAGPLAAALAGAGAGGIAGGILGALIGAGIPEERVKYYEEGIRQGGIVMGVNARNEEDAAHIQEGWTQSGGSHVIGTALGAGAGALAGAGIGAAAGPVGSAAGAVIGGISGGLAGKGAGEVVNPKAGDHLSHHHLAEGVGAGSGAAAGAALGAVGGPAGMAAGAAVGALAGGALGQAAGRAVNPVAEEGYWRQAYLSEPYYTPGYTYDDYGPAYELGYNSAARYPSYDLAEQHMADEWERVRGPSRLSWAQARAASRAAWSRIERTTADDMDRAAR